MNMTEGSQSYYWGCEKAGGNCSADPMSGGHDMWHDLKPGTDVVGEIFYSANFYTTTAVGIIKSHAATEAKANPLFLYLPYQVRTKRQISLSSSSFWSTSPLFGAGVATHFRWKCGRTFTHPTRTRRRGSKSTSNPLLLVISGPISDRSLVVLERTRTRGGRPAAARHAPCRPTPICSTCWTLGCTMSQRRSAAPACGRTP